MLPGVPPSAAPVRAAAASPTTAPTTLIFVVLARWWRRTFELGQVVRIMLLDRQRHLDVLLDLGQMESIVFASEN